MISQNQYLNFSSRLIAASIFNSTCTNTHLVKIQKKNVHTVIQYILIQSNKEDNHNTSAYSFIPQHNAAT